MLDFTFMIVTFFVGTLFGTKHVIYTQAPLISTRKQWLSNKVFLNFKANVIKIPIEGMNIWSLNYTDYVPCHDLKYINTLKILNYSQRVNF